MRSNLSFILLGALIASSAIASDAWARPTFPNMIPNGSFVPPGATRNCQICHVRARGGSPWNDFGQPIRDQLVEQRNNGQTPRWSWSEFVDQDPDGDNQTNGQELGDPCGTWTSGPAPRTTSLSAPGDPASTSADPDTPSCNPDAGFPDTGIPPDTGVVPDTGVSPPDTGVEPPDAGFAPPADAGFIVITPPATDDYDEGGCTCAPRTRGAPAFGLLLGALAIGVLVRRRRSL